ncbi:MAG TPA: hypothetical protein VLG16_03420 [Candidatus Saccharimonadales bacterium]|nr:hypothetical protein [Candidatus Saccharimonadales bacterium]
MTIQEIAAKIKERTFKRSPILIAIDGFGGAGKSTTAQKLRDELGNAYLIAIDDFILKEKLQEQTADETYFDRKRLENEVLMPAKQGEPIKYRRLEWIENKIGNPIEVPVVAYLIVEGISTFHPDIAKYFDFKIWVDTPIEVAKGRGLARDAGNENAVHWDLWAANDLLYQEKYHPEQRADFIVENSELGGPTVFQISVPEYKANEKPDFLKVGKKFDRWLEENFTNEDIVLRCLGVQDHPGKTLDQLADSILKTGTDKYDLNRTGQGYNVGAEQGKHIDFFGTPIKVRKGTNIFASELLSDFHDGALGDRGYAIRIDLVIVYDASKLVNVEHLYGKDIQESDGFVFRDPENKKDALLAVLKIY